MAGILRSERIFFEVLSNFLESAKEGIVKI